MNILHKITGFDWDDGNERKNDDKHAVSQSESEQLFFNEPLKLLPDHRHSQGEDRWHALGKTYAGRLLHITFTLRFEQSTIRVISTR